MVESDTPKKKKLQEQIDVQVVREMEEQLAREDQRRDEQIASDAEIARIHAKEELQMLIDGLDRKMKRLPKHYAKVLKYQSQQRKPLSKKQQREFYMSVLKIHSDWKTKHFKGLTLEEKREKFILVWKQIDDFVPMASKEKKERFKRKGIRLKRKGLNLEKEQVKKQKSSEEPSEIETSTEEFTKEKMKEMMQLVPVEDVYVQALQVKHHIIDWKVHTEGQRSYW
nr:hypothetical protein [Tanacetum cinerariifolium]